MITKRELERRGKLKVTSLVDKFQRDQAECIARIKWIAADRRTRVLKDDQLKWMEEKMREINRLVKMLPGKAWKPKRAKP